MSNQKDVNLASDHFYNGLSHLRESAKLLRGNTINASSETMATEIALTKAIQILEAAGFLTAQPLIPSKFSK